MIKFHEPELMDNWLVVMPSIVERWQYGGTAVTFPTNHDREGIRMQPIEEQRYTLVPSHGHHSDMSDEHVA